jgi:hypothetical protein
MLGQMEGHGGYLIHRTYSMRTLPEGAKGNQPASPLSSNHPKPRDLGGTAGHAIMPPEARLGNFPRIAAPPGASMIPMDLLPGAAGWCRSLQVVLGHPGPVWVYGAPGTGVSTMGGWLASQRGVELLDDADRLRAPDLEAWIALHPRGVLGAHAGPEAPALAEPASRCLVFRLQTLAEDPAQVEPCLAAMADQEGCREPLPPALAALPCPGNLRGLRNRLVRWRLLGQAPEAPAPDGLDLPLESEDIAANLHVLERVLLHRALRRSYGNRVETAVRLGVSRRQLYLLIARHGDPVRGEPPSSAGPKRLRRRPGAGL